MEVQYILVLLLVMLCCVRSVPHRKRPDCSAVSCMLPSCLNFFTPPGECCPVCPEGRCSYKNRVLADGQTLKDGCNSCTCRDGNLVCVNLPRYCFNVDCPDLEDCYNPYAPPGECCQRCGTNCRAAFCGLPPPNCELYIPPGQCCEVCKTRTCFHNGKYVAEGETIQIDCNTCTCSNGVLQCTEKACRRCSYKNNVLTEGQTLKDGCNSCTCRDGGNLVCVNLPRYCFNVDCPDLEDCYNPYTPPGECCQRCGTDCRAAFCGLPPPNCELYIPPGQCCEVCQTRTCFHNGKYVAEGETIQIDCKTCTCSNGVLQCTEKACRRCSYKNNVLTEGQTLKDGCNSCTCRDGNLVCVNLPRYCFDVDCPDLEDCYNPYTPPGECCQRCGTDCRAAFCGLPPPNCELYIPPGQCCEVCKTLEEKPGSCPRARGPGMCAELCSTDQSCRGDEKCCSNGCGHVCMDPFPKPSDCSNVICEPPPRNCKRLSTPPGLCCPVCRKCKHYGHRRYRG